MFKNTQILSLVSAMADHATRQHAVIADNIANSDTPGYQSRTIADFSDIFKKAKAENMSLGTAVARAEISTEPMTLTPDGNGVSLDDQMMLSAKAKADHDLALAIYKKNLDLLKMTVGKNL